MSGPSSSRRGSSQSNLASDMTSSSKNDELKKKVTGAKRVHTVADQSVISVGLDLSAVAFGCAVISLLFQTYAPQPYMDEPFHVTQAQKYCLGQFSEWDPKITTFPGLYLVAAAVGRAHQTVLNILFAGSNKAQLCGTGVLRAVNIGFAAACFLLLHALYRKIHPFVSSEYATQMALAILLLPTNFFYIFLFYTDVGSLAFVLASLLVSALLPHLASVKQLDEAALKRRYFLSGAAAAAAVMFRQTNAVWTIFVLMAAVLQRFYGHNLEPTRKSGLAKQIVVTLKLCWLNKRWLLEELWPLLLVPAAFAGFVVWNGGIVVGDRSNHTPVLHLVQPLYFLLFTAAAFWQIHFQPGRLSEALQTAADRLRRKPAAVLKPLGMAFVLAGYVVHNFTLVHPFVVADNRHYVFYLWKDVIAPYPAAKYSLVPLYLYSGWSLRKALSEGGQLDIWLTGLAACVMLTLVPAWLLEFRYFTTPAVLVALHAKPPSQAQLLLTTAVFAVVNAITIYVFLFRPFRWADGSIARFMW